MIITQECETMRGIDDLSRIDKRHHPAQCTGVGAVQMDSVWLDFVNITLQLQRDGKCARHQFNLFEISLVLLTRRIPGTRTGEKKMLELLRVFDIRVDRRCNATAKRLCYMQNLNHDPYPYFNKNIFSLATRTHELNLYQHDKAQSLADPACCET
ncbi:hypothetical protein D3C85_1114470 [compost metagenome]